MGTHLRMSLFVLLLVLTGAILSVSGKHSKTTNHARRHRRITNSDCKDEQPFPNKSNCHKFYQCLKSQDGTWTLTYNTCDIHSHYNPQKQMCVSGTSCNQTEEAPKKLHMRHH